MLECKWQNVLCSSVPQQVSYIKPFHEFGDRLWVEFFLTVLFSLYVLCYSISARVSQTGMQPTSPWEIQTDKDKMSGGLALFNNFHLNLSNDWKDPSL